MIKGSLFLKSALLAFLSSSFLIAQGSPHKAFSSQKISTGWMPNGPALFPEAKADPNQARCSIGYQNQNESNLVAAELGFNLPFWRTAPIWKFDNIELGFWSSFGMRYPFNEKNDDGELSENMSWAFAFPISAQIGETRLRLRLLLTAEESEEVSFTQTNSLGGGIQQTIVSTEKTIIKPGFKILEASVRTPLYRDSLQGYATAGYLFGKGDDQALFDRFYLETGLEYYGREASFHLASFDVEPYVALHSRFWSKKSFDPSYKAVLGLSWTGKVKSSSAFETSLEYSNARSLEEPFVSNPEEHLALQITYRF